MEDISASNFSFWCPLEITKATDANGGEIMRLGGIASTIDEDSDGEYLDPKGFDIKPLLEKGLVNWHHQAKSNPGTIVGEPTKAEIRKEGLYIETDLYPSSPIARDIYELAQTLEKDSKTRRLGYSIEGKVVKRKSNDKNSPDYKHIEKAIITGVAITHMPKNPKTFANIIKGDIDDDPIEEEETKEIEKEEPEAVSDTNEEKDDKEGLDTKKGRALIKEDVDDKLKNLTFGKAAVMERLFKDIPGITIEKASKISELINNIAIMAKRTKVTEDDIQKAYDALGLSAPDDLFKGEDEDENTAPEDDEEVEETEEEEVDVKPAKGKKSDEEETEEDEEEVDETTKAQIFNCFERIEKAMVNSYSGQVNYFKALGALLKDTNQKFEKAMEDLEIANDNINTLTEINKAQSETINELMGVIEAFGNSTPGPKSLRHTAAVERDFMNKGENPHNFGGNSGNQQVSIRNRQVVSEILDQATFAKGYDEEFSKAVTSFEASKTLPKNIRERISREYGIDIVD